MYQPRRISAIVANWFQAAQQHVSQAAPAMQRLQQAANRLAAAMREHDEHARQRTMSERGRTPRQLLSSGELAYQPTLRQRHGATFHKDGRPKKLGYFLVDDLATTPNRHHRRAAAAQKRTARS